MATPGQKTKAVIEALESGDPDHISRIRGSQLGSLTRSLKDLEFALVVLEDYGKLDLPKISDGRVKHLGNQARNSYDNVALSTYTRGIF